MNPRLLHPELSECAPIRPGRYIVEGQRCACFSSSKSSTSTSTQDNRIVAGDYSTVLSNARVDINSGNITAGENASIRIGVDAGDLAGLIGGGSGGGGGPVVVNGGGSSATELSLTQNQKLALGAAVVLAVVLWKGRK